MLNDLLKKNNKRLILASKSPRRQELLKGLDVGFEVKTKDTDESYDESTPLFDVAEVIAGKKALAFRNELKTDEIIITSDTVVIVGDEILGKPKTKIQAFDMLTKLSGKSHFVVTGVCLMSSNKKVVFNDVTKVFFKPLTYDEMNYYIKTYKPFDKAGSYGIQEWIGFIGIDKIEGSYFNVMGLPVDKLYNKLFEML
jgi:septum formation protein